jgi:hypothetical protein
MNQSQLDGYKLALMDAIKRAQGPQDSFNDRFPSDPSVLQQIGTGLAHGAESQLANAKWILGGMNGPAPPMYTGGPTYPLQSQDLQNSKIAGDARAQAGGYVRSLAGDPNAPPVRYMSPDYNPPAPSQPTQSLMPEWLRQWQQNRAVADMENQQKLNAIRGQ